MNTSMTAFFVRVGWLAAMTALGTLLPLQSALPVETAADALLPARPAFWPAGDGYEIRSSQLRLRYSAQGELLQSESFPHAGTRAVPLVFALPAEAGAEAVGLGVMRGGPPWSRAAQCLRHPGPDGTWTEIRLDRLNIEGSVIDPPPPWPRLIDYREDAYEAPRIAGDAEGIVYATAFGGRLLAFAPDCERLDTSARALNNVVAVSARREFAGAFVVEWSADSRRFVLQRLLKLQPAWTWTIESLAGPRVWALADGSALLALQGGASGEIQLLRLAGEDGRVLANTRVDGQQVAGFAEVGDRLLLAVTRGSDTAVLALDLALSVRESHELASLQVHGSVVSAEHGLHSPYWLVSDQRGELGRAPWVPGIAYAVLRPRADASVDTLSPLQTGRRPVLVERSGAVLLMEELDGGWDLLRRRPDGSEQRLPRPQTPDPARSLAQATQADRFGALGIHAGPGFGSLQFSAWDSEGRALWTRSLSGYQSYYGRTLVARSSAQAPSCLVYLDGSSRHTRLACFSSAAGELLFDRVLRASSDSEWVHLGRVDAQGRVRLLLQRLPVGNGETPLVQLSMDSEGAVIESILGGSSAFPHVSGMLSQAKDGRAVIVLPQVSTTRVLSVDLDQQTRVERDLDEPNASWWVGDVDAEGRSLLLEFDAGGLKGLMRLHALDADLQPIGAIDLAGSALAGLTSQQLREYAWALDAAGGRALVAVRREAGVELLGLPYRAGAEALRLQLPLAPEPQWLRLAESAQPGFWQVATLAGERLELRGLRLQPLRLAPPTSIQVALGIGPSAASPGWALSPEGLWTPRRHAVTRMALDSPPVLAALPAAEQALDARHSGLWYDPQSTGQGLMLDVEAANHRWFAAWFNFDRATLAFGTTVSYLRPALRWYSMLGQGDAASGMPIAGTLYSTAGGRFDGGAPQTAAQGQGSLRAIDCNTLEFSYATSDPANGAMPVLFGARRLQRLGPAPAACGGASLAEQSGLSAASTGSWVLEGRPNQGLLMQVDPGIAGGAGAVWGAWFGFDAGEPDDALGQHWLTVTGRSAAGQSGVVELEWMRTLGGSFDAQPTRNTRVIGTGRLRFTACDRAVLEYSFDAPGLPGDAFAGLQGQVNLRRFESCR